MTKHANRQELVNRLDAITDLPLTVLSILMIPLLIGPLLSDIDHKTEMIYTILDTALWSIFLIDILIKIAISPQKWKYVNEHRLNVILALVPWLRFLRVIRSILIIWRLYRGAGRLARIDLVLIYALLLVIISATGIFLFEQGETSSFHIKSYHDAIWWALVTVSTVGYGDLVPATLGGRLIALILMFGGVALFGAVTANVATLFTKSSQSNELETLVANLTEEVRDLRNEIRKSSDT